MDGIKPCEIQVTTVHHVKGACFYQEQVQDVDIVYPAFGDMDELRYAAAQIQKGMEFDSSFGFPEPGRLFLRPAGGNERRPSLPALTGRMNPTPTKIVGVRFIEPAGAMNGAPAVYVI